MNIDINKLEIKIQYSVNGTGIKMFHVPKDCPLSKALNELNKIPNIQFEGVMLCKRSKLSMNILYI